MYEGVVLGGEHATLLDCAFGTRRPVGRQEDVFVRRRGDFVTAADRQHGAFGQSVDFPRRAPHDVGFEATAVARPHRNQVDVLFVGVVEDFSERDPRLHRLRHRNVVLARSLGDRRSRFFSLLFEYVHQRRKPLVGVADAQLGQVDDVQRVDRSRRFSRRFEGRVLSHPPWRPLRPSESESNRTSSPSRSTGTDFNGFPRVSRRKDVTTRQRDGFSRGRMNN